MGPRFFALELTEKVMVLFEVVTVPELDDAVSQLGRFAIAYCRLPLEAFSV